jgi:hypothetical protein
MKRYLPTACGQVVAIHSEKAIVLPLDFARDLLSDTRRWADDFRGTSLGLSYREWADDLEAALCRADRLALAA